MSRITSAKSKFTWQRAAPFAITAAAIGAIVVVLVSAAGTPIAFEAETGTLAGGAAVTSVAGQSGTGAVKFGQAQAGTCVGANHTPGGPDGMGGCWPGPQNTGVPAGTVLTTYTGPSGYQDINGTLVIDKKIVNSELRIYGTGNAKVTITNSIIHGNIDFELTGVGASLTISDSELDVGNGILAGVGNTNWTGVRLNIHGATTGADCAGNCVLRDSWLHNNYIPPTGDYHLGGFLSNGGTGITLIHNSVMCDAVKNPDGGSCSGDLNMFGDSAPISTVLADSNLFGANNDISYCTYAGDSSPTANGHKPYPYADHVVYQNNIFQRGPNHQCGSYGPVTGFNPAEPGNQWINNLWDDGTAVQSAN